MIRSAWLLLAFALSLTAFQDLDSVGSEPNLEKRSEKALVVAERQMTAAAGAYNSGDSQTAFREAEAVLKSVEYAVNALAESGKNPHGSKYYKRAEQKTRLLARKLSDFSESVSYEDRPRFLKVRDGIQTIHDRLLEQILSRKKK